MNFIKEIEIKDNEFERNEENPVQSFLNNDVIQGVFLF